MEKIEMMLVFGPVPSRRLGRSLGINNIPAKVCSYSCVYCQLGKTLNMKIERGTFYKPEDIFRQVKNKVDEVTSKGEKIDYLTFVPSGEPTLDANLGKEISLLKHIGISVAVLTNASLIWREDVREELLEADLVSLKVDAVNENFWRKINRPCKGLKLKKILEGLIRFAEEFNGKIVSETMLIDNINYKDEFKNIAEFLVKLKRLNKAYITIPIRPPTEKWVKPAKKEIINHAFHVFSKKLGMSKVECLTSHTEEEFTPTGNVEEDLLNIVAVHPMREEEAIKFLEKVGKNRQIIEKLLKKGKLKKLEYEGNIYYIKHQKNF